MPRLRHWRRPAGPATALTLGVALAGCAGPLPFQPERQPFGLTISAGVTVRDDRLLVTIASEGYRVERATLVRHDGREVAPEALVPPSDPPSSGVSLGVGLGGGRASGRYSAGAGVGFGVGGPYREATTLVAFHRDEAGPPPWRLRAKIVGVEPVDIVMDPARSSGH